ncbi:hypothetical protein ACTRXD_01210 [Nitrospira sp. T9]|uniref:hypothetical protein n=1 Tax=unclassified Nitrospira TaxID=2652172 RepID=UPI003F968FAA
MTEPDTSLPHITTTETLVRFYVLLSQYIDRCLDEATKRSLPEGEFQKHLAETHTQVTELLTTNRVVKNKAETEFQRITTLCEQFLKTPNDPTLKSSLHHEHDVLRIKMLALSDLLAVFRSV